MDFGLRGKYALVAGGGRGIGKSIARELAREGVDVAIASRTVPELESTARELAEETGQRIIPLALDVTKRDQVDRVVAEAAERLGGLHILVNSAALPGGSSTASGPVEAVNDDDLLWDFDVKYVGALRCARAAIPFLKEQGWGRIVNISGHNGRNAGNLSAGARNVSLVHLTKTLSIQLGSYGITVNCVYPGIIRTERTPGVLAERAAQASISPEEMERRDYAPGSPRSNAIGRMVESYEIACLTVFLASGQAHAITGEVIEASGGVGNAVNY